MKTVTVTVMDGHGDGRSGTKWNEMKKSVTVTVTSRDGHGHVTFSVKNERFTLSEIMEPIVKSFR
jgi:hypothetical protein